MRQPRLPLAGVPRLSVHPGRLTLLGAASGEHSRARAAHEEIMSTASATVSRADFDGLVSDLTAAAAAYYDSDVLLMTDAEYDAGMEQVQGALQDHPDWANDDSDALLAQVAGGQSAGGDVTHPTRMLSMEKASAGEEGLAEVAAFVETVQTADFKRRGVVVEPKMDGLALRAEYRDGRLVLAATRGDGTTGEDVTVQVVRGDGVAGLPLVLDEKWTGEVRGEVFMTAEQFAQAQTLRADRGGKPFVNPRNATAGALRKSGDEHWMPLSFAAYGAGGDGSGEMRPHIRGTFSGSGHTWLMDVLGRLGFTTARSLLVAAGVETGPFDTPEAVRDAIEAIEVIRPDLGFDIDGAVIKADSDSARQTLGEGSRTPRWALAYKYAAEEATAVVEDIEVTVGRTGRMGLRARITPTFVGGTTVTYATLHNPGWVVEQGIGVGSTVVLKRAGDVIPRITAPLDTSANADVPPWAPPAVCPQCGEGWNTESLLWHCETPSCGLVNAIAYWTSRDALDIEHVGAAIAEALVVNGTVTDLADLYFLSTEQWETLPVGETTTGAVRALGATMTVKVLAEIEKSKSQPLARVLTGLGIRGTGRSMSRALAAHFGSLAALAAADVEQIAEVEKIGPKKAQMIHDWFRTTANARTVERLALAGLTVEAAPVTAGGPLDGKTVVISGSVPGYSRNEANEAVVAAGGKSSGSVSKNTTYLVTAETTTSKAQKAEQLGVPVIDPADFAALLRGETR